MALITGIEKQKGGERQECRRGNDLMRERASSRVVQRPSVRQEGVTRTVAPSSHLQIVNRGALAEVLQVLVARRMFPQQ